MKYHLYRFFSMSLLAAGASQAAEPAYPNFDFNAYGTVGAAYSTEDKADFVDSIGQTRGAGASKDVDFGADSRLGLQLTASLTPRFTAVAQVVSDQQYDNSYAPYFEWANLKYDFTPDLSMRVGRIVLPSFIVSDYRKVGYATHWVRPPLEVYTLVPITNSDGIDVSYRFRRGGFTNTLQVFAGSKKLHFGGRAGTFEAKRLQGFTNTLEWGAALLRASFNRADLTAVTVAKPLFDALRLFGPQGIAIADRYAVADSRVKALVLGARYDPGEWFAMAEWVRTSNDSFLGVDRGWYVTGGYRHGALTPFVTYSTRRAVDDYASEQGLNPALLPPPAQAAAVLLNNDLQGLLRSNDSSTLSVGTRWDFHENFNLTVQVDHIELDGGSVGGLVNLQPGFVPGGSLNVLAATVSFVY